MACHDIYDMTREDECVAGTTEDEICESTVCFLRENKLQAVE